MKITPEHLNFSTPPTPQMPYIQEIVGEKYIFHLHSPHKGSIKSCNDMTLLCNARCRFVYTEIEQKGKCNEKYSCAKGCSITRF